MRLRFLGYILGSLGLIIASSGSVMAATGGSSHDSDGRWKGGDDG